MSSDVQFLDSFFSTLSLIAPGGAQQTCLSLLIHMSMSGDTKTTTRRLSDTSTSEHDQFKRPGRRATKEEKSMLDSAHETVAKALGEGSRGKMIAASNVYSSELMGHLGAVQEVAD